MLISKKPDIALNSQLVVDSWNTEHVENVNTGVVPNARARDLQQMPKYSLL